MERLSGIDAAFLYMETRVQHMHVVGVTIMDPSTIPGGYHFPTAQAEFTRRLTSMQAFRRRLAQFPLGLDHPVWVEDHLDIEYHVRRAALPSPGDRPLLEAFVGDYASRPLDRSRPLWEVCLVEGLDGGRVAMLTKVHHSIIDGVSGAQMMSRLYDLAPDGVGLGDGDHGHHAIEDVGEIEEEPSLVDLAFTSLRARIADPIRAASLLGRTAVSVGTAIAAAMSDEETTERPTLPMAAPTTPFSHSLTRRRAVSFARAELADLKLVKNTFEVTINDVVLAACTLALRRDLQRRDALPDRPLVASVPVSTRLAGEVAASFNRVSAMFVSLPVQIEDPIEQLRAVHADAVMAKKMIGAFGRELLGDVVELLPPLLFAQAMKLYSRLHLAETHAPVHNLVVSNVPGPPIPMYAAGAKVLAVYPLGPILENAALNITVFSYLDGVDIGVVTCPDLIPDVELLVDGVAEAIADLAEIAALAGLAGSVAQQGRTMSVDEGDAPVPLPAEPVNAGGPSDAEAAALEAEAGETAVAPPSKPPRARRKPKAAA